MPPTRGRSSPPDSDAPALPEVALKLIRPKNPAIARVAGNTVCTYGKSNAWVRDIAVDVSGTALEGNFRVGQSFGVIPPGLDDKGKPHKVRLYSIASPDAGEDGAGKVICTPVKRVIDEFKPQKPGDPEGRGMFMGVCSNYLCDLSVGDEVRISGPVGKRFLLPVDPEQHDYVFVATGTGIAPFRGMVMGLLEGQAQPIRSKIYLLMGSPYTSDLLYHDLFLRLESQYENFHYLQAISREPRPNGDRGIYVDALVEEHRDQLGPVLENPHTLMYLCGLAGMEFGMYRRLAQLGLLDGYATLTDALDAVPVGEWTTAQMRKHIKPNPRCMLEVY